jgi:hypothetical protein
MKYMAEVSQKIMKVWTDSKMTDAQKAAAIKKLKEDGAKWYSANCGAKSKEEDEVTNLFEDDSELAMKRKNRRKSSAQAAKKARMMRRRKATAMVKNNKRRRRHDEDDMLEEDSELMTKGQCVASAKALMKKVIQTGFSTKLSIDQKKAILKKLKA